MDTRAALLRLARSPFRARFRLDSRDLALVARIGLPAVEAHAADFIRTRLAPASPPSDGRQTPMRGHPVFKAQHATATCCRSCLAKWHRIPPGQPIPPSVQRDLVALLMAWIRQHLPPDFTPPPTLF